MLQPRESPSHWPNTITLGGQKELRPNILILSSTLARLRYMPLNF